MSYYSAANSATNPASESVNMKRIAKDNTRMMWSTERGVVDLLQISTNITQKIQSSYGCVMTLDADTGTVTIDGDKATEAGKWFENKAILVRVNRVLKLPVFIAAMRLLDVAREVASTLKQFPASIGLTDQELIVYAWHPVNLKKVDLAVDEVVAENQVEVYKFANNSRCKQSFYNLLNACTTQYANSVCIQVDETDCSKYHIAGLVEHVQLVCNNLLPFQCYKIERIVSPSQAQLLQAYGGSLFDSTGDYHMTLSVDNSEMVVFYTCCIEAEVMQKCDIILDQIVSESCNIPRKTDTDMTAMSHLLNDIEIKHRVVIQYDQSDNRDNRKSRSEQMFVGMSYCVEISDKTQLRLVEADITDLCVDAIVSTIDEHGTPNTTLAKHIVTKGGPAVEDKLKQKVTRKLSSGAVVMCDGGQLPCKSVIHVQYPPARLTTTYDNFLSSDESKALKCCIDNILDTCKDPKHKFNTIAIPVIGSYSNKEKLTACMWHMAEALRKSMEEIKSLSVRHIVLVTYGTDNFKSFRYQLELVFAGDKKIKFNVADKYFTINNCFVSLMTGDLLNMKVDAIVVAIPQDKILTRGGLATSIQQKDPNIQRQLQDCKWEVKVAGGGVIVCQSNKLASRYVFLIHLPHHSYPTAQQLFHIAIDACLKKAIKQDIKSIAFPILGTGVLNYPDDFVATCMTTLIERFCQGRPGKCTDIRIVRYNNTEGTAFVNKVESLALKIAGKCLPCEKAKSQITHNRQASEATADVLRFNITGFDVESVTSARNSVWRVFTGCHDDTLHSWGVATGASSSSDKSLVSNSESSTRAVWVYEDMNEQWTEFIPGLQATLEDDYSTSCERSDWQEPRPDRRIHTVNFKTQPMTYIVKCGDTIELSTIVERRANDANSWSIGTRGGDERRVDVSEVEDGHNTHTGEPQVGTTSAHQEHHGTHVRSKSRSPERLAGDDRARENDSNIATAQHNPTDTPRPSAKRKKNNGQQQDDDIVKDQSTDEHKLSTHHPDTMDAKPTYINTAPQNNKPSANRKICFNPPDQSSKSKSTTVEQSLSQQLSTDSQVVKSRDNVAMTTKYTWDSNIPSYWAPMDGSSVKTVVLHPSDSEYQLVADTFLASLGNTLATVIQIERIQNPNLHKQYVNNKEIMDKTNSPTTKNERRLWHGITVTTTQHGPMPITAINNRGFNRSYTGNSSGEAVYGNGTYFAVEARKALHYSNPDVNGHRHMYWCRVLTGEYMRGRTDLIVAPVKTKDSYDLYDSVVDIVESPTLFVIFEDAHAYPDYLITFK